MGSEHFGLVVIGGGSAGYAAARTYAAARGPGSVAVVDGAERLGGLCILRGCMPSKTLLWAAEVLHQARHAERLGLRIDGARADLPALQARKRRLVDEWAGYRAGQLASERFRLFRAQARFAGPDRVELNTGETLTADAFVLATGSALAYPPVPGLAGTPHYTSDDILELAALPRSIITLGGGVVACELTQYLARMGVRMTQIQRGPRLLKELSPEVSAVIGAAFAEEGITVVAGTAITRVEPTATGVAVDYRKDGADHRAEADALFLAMGRRPQTDGLRLDLAGVQTRPSGHIATDGAQRTANPRVFAVGDVAGPLEIVHLAVQQGETAARAALGQPFVPVNLDHALQIYFTDPQIGFVGLPEDELRARGIPFVSASYPFNDHGKSVLMEALHGHVRCWAEQGTGRLLAAECVGPSAGELIHPLSVGLALGANVRQLASLQWYHPTLSEIWTYPLEDCADAAGV